MSEPSLGPEDLRRIAGWLQAAGLASIEIEDGDRRLRIVVPAAPRTALPVAPAMAEVLAGASGIFLDRHPLRASPFVVPGGRVEDGAIIGLLRTGLIHRPVTAPRAGTLQALLIEPGTLVGYGTPLMRLA